MNERPVLVILPGGTATTGKLTRCAALARVHWPGGDVRVADFRSRWRGVEAGGRWLDEWCRHHLQGDAPVFLLAFILGAAVLPYAGELRRRVRRAVLLRSRHQEAVPRRLRRILTPVGATLLLGRAVADLGRPRFWPDGFTPEFPCLVLLETECSRLAAQLDVSPLSDAELGISAYREVAISHDDAYASVPLIETATGWLAP